METEKGDDEDQYETRPCINNAKSCDDEDCFGCAARLCEFGDPLHFHHDGCPSCYMNPPGYHPVKKGSTFDAWERFDHQIPIAKQYEKKDGRYQLCYIDNPDDGLHPAQEVISVNIDSKDMVVQCAKGFFDADLEYCTESDLEEGGDECVWSNTMASCLLSEPYCLIYKFPHRNSKMLSFSKI